MDVTPNRRNDKDLKKRLTKEQYQVTQERGTEEPYTNKYWNCDDGGVYHCVCCGAELFTSDDKFDSGCGWPSFTKPSPEASTLQNTDLSHGMVRTEVVCGECGAHLGHVFQEESAPGGVRYCINSASLDLKKAEQ